MCERVRRNADDAYNSENSNTRFTWLVLPILTGCLFGLLPQREYRAPVGVSDGESYDLGAVLRTGADRTRRKKWSLTKLTRVFCVLLAVLTILSAGVIIYRWHLRDLIRRTNRTNLVITALAAVLILAVAGGFAANRTEEHTVEQVMTMYMTDSLYEYDAMTGKSRADMMDFEKETLDAQKVAPVAAYYAVYVRMSNLHPAKFVRILLPVFYFRFIWRCMPRGRNICLNATRRKNGASRSWCGFYMRFR